MSFQKTTAMTSDDYAEMQGEFRRVSISDEFDEDAMAALVGIDGGGGGAQPSKTPASSFSSSSLASSFSSSSFSTPVSWTTSSSSSSSSSPSSPPPPPQNATRDRRGKEEAGDDDVEDGVEGGDKSDEGDESDESDIELYASDSEGEDLDVESGDFKQMQVSSSSSSSASGGGGGASASSVSRQERLEDEAVNACQDGKNVLIQHSGPDWRGTSVIQRLMAQRKSNHEPYRVVSNECLLHLQHMSTVGMFACDLYDIRHHHRIGSGGIKKFAKSLSSQSIVWMTTYLQKVRLLIFPSLLSITAKDFEFMSNLLARIRNKPKEAFGGVQVVACLDVMRPDGATADQKRTTCIHTSIFKTVFPAASRIKFQNCLQLGRWQHKCVTSMNRCSNPVEPNRLDANLQQFVTLFSKTHPLVCHRINQKPKHNPGSNSVPRQSSSIPGPSPLIMASKKAVKKFNQMMLFRQIAVAKTGRTFDLKLSESKEIDRKLARFASQELLSLVPIRKELVLCVGAPVMLTCDLDEHSDLVAGSLGYVVRFEKHSDSGSGPAAEVAANGGVDEKKAGAEGAEIDNSCPVVYFPHTNQERIIQVESWYLSDPSRNTCGSNITFMALPLVLAWALSIYDIQKLKLSAITVNIDDQALERSSAFLHTISHVASPQNLSLYSSTMFGQRTYAIGNREKQHVEARLTKLLTIQPELFRNMKPLRKAIA